MTLAEIFDNFQENIFRKMYESSTEVTESHIEWQSQRLRENGMLWMLWLLVRWGGWEEKKKEWKGKAAAVCFEI